MAGFHNLIIYQLARHNLRDVAAITASTQGFGDLTNQMRRAAISVVSNICEGSGHDSSKQLIRFLITARASNLELQAQLTILADLGHIPHDHPIHDRCDHAGRSISKLIRRLSG